MLRTPNKTHEAERGVSGLETARFLGWEVCSAPKKRVIRFLGRLMDKKSFVKPFFVVTAYSETFLEVDRNPEFKQALGKADLIVADGVMVAAGRDYLASVNKGLGGNIWEGVRIAGKILRGGYAGDVIRGVELAKELVADSGGRSRKVFLLGGWGGVAGRLAAKLKLQYPRLQIDWDEGAADVKREIQNSNYRSNLNRQIISKINTFKPEVLLVALGRFTQEIWIAQNLEKLDVGVVVGVGSSFDELTEEGIWKVPVPAWVNRRGLKWAWRMYRDPKHLTRVINAWKFTWEMFRKKATG